MIRFAAYRTVARLLVLPILAGAAMLAAAGSCLAQTRTAEDLIVNYDQSQLVKLPRPAAEIIIGNPSIADVSVQNGNLLWSREMSTLTGVSFDARYAFVSDDKGAVQAFDRTNGRSVWKQDKLSLRQLTLPLPAGDVIAVGDFEGYVHFLSRESGAFLARYRARGGGVRAAPILLPTGMLVQTHVGSLHALSL